MRKTAKGKKSKDRFCNRLDFYLKIRKALNVFDAVEYSVITGSFVQNDKKFNDVDIVTVLPYTTQKTSEQIKTFAKSHVSGQVKNNFMPDFNFPTDVVSRQQIIDAVGGRAFDVVDKQITLKTYSNEEIINNPESDYRVWLYEMITHNFDLITGNFESLVSDTITALKTAFLWSFCFYKYNSSVPMEKLRGDIFSAAGLPSKLNEKQCRYLLIMLDVHKFGEIMDDGLVYFNKKNIEKEILKFKTSIVQKKFKKSNHIISWDVIRNAVNKYKA